MDNFDFEEFIRETREEIRSSDPDEVIRALWPFKPRIGRGRDRSKEPLDDQVAGLIPDIRLLLDDHRICCLTPVVAGVQVRYYGEVRWYATTVLAEMFSQLQSTEPLVLKDVVRPFTYWQAHAIAKQNDIDTTGTRRDSFFEVLHEKGLLTTIPEINFNGGRLGALFYTGWVDYFEKKDTE